jgi:hypothetical protein
MPEERAAEYLDYRQFFLAWETLKRVMEYHALEAPQMSQNRVQNGSRTMGYALFFFLSPVSRR